MLFEHRLLFGEFGDAVEACGDHEHLLLLFRIGNQFAKGAHFPRMLKPETPSHSKEVICLPLRTYFGIVRFRYCHRPSIAPLETINCGCSFEGSPINLFGA